MGNQCLSSTTQMSSQYFSKPSAKISADNGDCPVCYDNYNDAKLKIILDCNHHLCQKCLDNIMLYSQRRCPLCKDSFSFKKSSKESISLKFTLLGESDQLIDQIYENESFFNDFHKNKIFIDICNGNLSTPPSFKTNCIILCFSLLKYSSLKELRCIENLIKDEILQPNTQILFLAFGRDQLKTRPFNYKNALQWANAKGYSYCEVEKITLESLESIFFYLTQKSIITTTNNNSTWKCW